MNNRNPNKENTYTNLGAWCAQYHEQSGIKIHPSSVPYDLVLEDVLGYIAILLSHDKGMATAFDALNERVKHLEKQLEMVELRTQMLVEGGNTLDERLKELEQLKSTSTKKVK